MAIAELVMPKLGESIMEATILKWHKKLGDSVQLDETVLDIATDKVDSEVPSTVAGIITEILFNVNDVVAIGTVIARIETNTPGPAEQTTPIKEPDIEHPLPEAIEEDIKDIPYVPQVPQPAPATNPTTNRFYSPLVLNIANSEGIPLSELEKIPGTGNDGRVSKKDILQYLENKRAGISSAGYSLPATPALTPGYKAEGTSSRMVGETVFVPTPMLKPADSGIVAGSFEPISSSGKFSDPANVVTSGAIEIVEMDRMRKLIAKHMVDSVHTSPHVTSFAEADVTHMVLWRQKVKEEFEKREGTKITFTPMFLECIIAVMKRFPLINCSLEGDKILIKKDINIGMATALPSGNLIVPVIKGADQLNIVGLSKAVNHLADAARTSRLKPEDTTGGTFTVTNVGTFGSLMGTPIINQPQVAILAVGAIKKRAVVIETKEGDTIGVRHMMYLSLSYDHRIVDGSIGASFLSEVAKEFEKWDINRQWFHYL
jgi:2-oxoglutarate dehydrogenase E2 component (dihydrolipoamide succinyltransferase)